MMTIDARIIGVEEDKDFRKIKLRKRDIMEINGVVEVVAETHYDGKRLVRFGTVRKNEDGSISELGYCVGMNTGEIAQMGAGIHYWMNVPSPFRRSPRYPQLSRFLKKRR